MPFYRFRSDKSLETGLSGDLILQTPLLNKGTAFTEREREELGLNGLLPLRSATIDEQVAHCYAEYQKKNTRLGKHIYLRSLQDRNETLFYRLLRTHIGEMLEIVYTPVVGEACQHFSEIYRKPRGLFIAYPDRNRIPEILNNCSLPEVRAIVVTDGGRILGLGDQGAGGMGIPIGKMSLYTACGGLNPAYGLPIFLDAGTDNQALLKDPLYLGWRHPRVTRKEYADFVDLFVAAVEKKFPKVLLQWEDFSKDHASFLLNRYKDRLCTFNDDIQGTAAVSTAAILSAVTVLKQSIKDQRIVIFGAGSAGTGIAAHIVKAMVRSGATEEQAREKIWLIDLQGLVFKDSPSLAPYQAPFAKERLAGDHRNISFAETVARVHPTVLIGASAAAGAFTEEVIGEMAKHVERPIILPLSNPDTHCEARPEDLIVQTKGKALIATGTKFPDVHYEGNVYVIGQSNNHYIFPSVALGIFASEAERVSEEMFLAAAEKLSELSPALTDPRASLFPPPEQIPEISRKIAFSVAKEAEKTGRGKSFSDEILKARIDEIYWIPDYVDIFYKKI